MKKKAKPAIFLDRDGVLTKEKSYIRSTNELEIFPSSNSCIEKIHTYGYYAIVVSNQSGIARGYFTEETLLSMNQYLIQETGVDAVYYCPHHQKGVIQGYAFNCNCRKPAIGMLEKACSDFQITMNGSYVVGDRACDIRLGENANLKTVLLDSGYGVARLEEIVVPDYTLKDLRDFIKILERKEGNSI